MATTDILPYLDHLEDNLDALEESLNAFLPSQSVAATAKTLPLVDRAKLHVTVAYAIESLIFSYLRLHNLSPHAHPVFKELARVKSYFDKIKEIENKNAGDGGGKKPDVALDKSAAERVIKHALAGNRKIDLEAAEKKAREALLAKRRLKNLTARPEQQQQQQQQQPATSTEAANLPTEEDRSSSSSSAVVPSSVPASTPPPPSSSSNRPVPPGEEEDGEVGEDTQLGGGMEEGEVEESPSKSVKKGKRISKKERKRQREVEARANGHGNGNGDGGAGETTPRRAKKKRKQSLTGGAGAGAGATAADGGGD